MSKVDDHAEHPFVSAQPSVTLVRNRTRPASPSPRPVPALLPRVELLVALHSHVDERLNLAASERLTVDRRWPLYRYRELLTVLLRRTLVTDEVS